MSEKGSREGSTRRSSYRRSISETHLPPQYLAQLEDKRKQLDESIHKYIAAKEREYKLFERDIRQQHRAESSSNGNTGFTKRRGSAESSPADGHIDGPESQRRSAAVDALLGSSSRREPDDNSPDAEDHASGRQDRSTIAGLKDRRASLERDQDFAGLFTPPYLSALDDRDSRRISRTSSAPSTVQQTQQTEATDERIPMGRASSDGIMQAKPKRPSHLALSHRTSSSGSSADGKLASAMKSSGSTSSQQSVQSKRKRVSLAVGDSIVAPSDSVPLSLSQNSTSSHSRVRSSTPERELPTPVMQPSKAWEERKDSIESSLLVAEEVALANAVGAEKKHLPGPLAAATESPPPNSNASPKPRSSSSKLDPDGDLFGLEEEDEDGQNTNQTAFTEDALDDADEAAIESDDEITGRVEHAAESKPQGMESDEVRYDSTSGVIPEPADGTDSAVPYLAFGPGSAGASQQPTQPGFRRPSVVHDPIYRGTNYRAVERDAVENEIYGSSFSRPGSRSSIAAGSLGESYMAQHAEEMSKLRSSKQQNQVRS